MNVQVTVMEEKGDKAGISIANIIKAGVDFETKNRNNNVTSLEFEIPISLPETNFEYKREKGHSYR
ncbi:MAG: hypothetical protein ACPGVD_04870 [Flavobacteriales bacterium]